ncbi:hypothetical protein NEOLEDRAFT_1141113 [Neolentinus lepideus HHB14362 ss-1]|uniref:Uncharacterized protein n=1 Tax=Neolentinus lepideus HHB14362 ss-1 TaxID=1314782 RepID=A0A165NV47_9AGAM|nr:hypothetical protein NEOLEDRAFT_1141113 [Neolentinus lepideus HHB14362 ss-1]
MILLILLIFTLLATGLGFGLLYLAYLSRPTVYRFYWPSDSAEENTVEDEYYL